MISSNYIRSLFIVLAVTMISSSCRLFQTGGIENQANSESAGPAAGIPFSIKEPEIFQSEVRISTVIGGKKSVRKYFLARNRKSRLTVYDFGEPNESAVLFIDSERRFVLDKPAKTYRRFNGPHPGENEFANFLTTKLINEKREAGFEKVGTENGLTKYRITVPKKPGSERYIYIDPKLSIPVKEEFFFISNGQKASYSVVFVNLKQTVDPRLFEIPEGFRETESENP